MSIAVMRPAIPLARSPVRQGMMARDSKANLGRSGDGTADARHLEKGTPIHYITDDAGMEVTGRGSRRSGDHPREDRGACIYA